MSPIRRLFVIAFWLAAAFAYVQAVLPAADTVHLSAWDKLQHMIAFFTITFLARAAYPRIAIMLLFAGLAAFGGAIELSQAVPFVHRDAEWADWAADCIAIVAGLLVAWPFAVLADRRRGRRASAPEQAPAPAREK